MCNIKKKDLKIIISSSFEVIIIIRVLPVVNHTHLIKYPDKNSVTTWLCTVANAPIN